MCMVKKASAELCQSTFYHAHGKKVLGQRSAGTLFTMNMVKKVFRQSSADAHFTMNMVKSTPAKLCRGIFYHEHGKKCFCGALQEHVLPCAW